MIKTHNDLINEIVAIDYEILDVKLEGLVRDTVKVAHPEVSEALLESAVFHTKPFFWRDYVRGN